MLPNAPERGTVTEGAREEFAQALWPRYRLAAKAERGQMLDEYCRVTGCHRKAAIRALRRMPATGRRRAGRPRRYGRELEPILEQLWIASDGLSGKLLVPILPATADGPRTPPRRPGDAGGAPRAHERPCGDARSVAAPGAPGGAGCEQRARPSALAHVGRVGLGRSPGRPAGDLVLHCGDMTDGFFLTTLVAVDVATSWIELEAVWGTGHRRVGTGIHRIRERLPFALRAWHSDNGGEFPLGKRPRRATLQPPWGAIMSTTLSHSSRPPVVGSPSRLSSPARLKPGSVDPKSVSRSRRAPLVNAIESD